MKCYNHTIVDAISSCGECNKSLCKECYDLGVIGLCFDCYLRKKPRTSTSKSLKHLGNFENSYVALVIGGIVGLFIGLLISETSEISGWFSIVTVAVYAYMGFSLYWGLIVVSNIFKSILSWGFLLIFTWPVLIIILVTALFIGAFASIPMFIESKREFEKRNYPTPKIKY